MAEFMDGSVYRFPDPWRFDEEGYRANVTRYMSEITKESGQLVSSSVFDVYINGRNLVYIRDLCDPADTKAWFFLHIIPVDPTDLPERIQQYGFESYNFPFDRRAMRFGGKCLTTVDLPDYGIDRIRTGQYDDTGQLWSVEFILPDAGNERGDP